MKLTVAFAGAALILASGPAFAQLAGSGNLLGTQGTQPNWPGVNHQSTTQAAAGGGTRGVLYNVNGGDLAPGLQKSNIRPVPGAVSSNTQNRSVGAWVEVGPQSGGVGKGATVRANVDNSLGAGPTNVYRGIDVNAPSQAGGVIGKAPGGGNPSSGTVTNLAGNGVGGGNLAGNSLVSNATGKLK